MFFKYVIFLKMFFVFSIWMSYREQINREVNSIFTQKVKKTQ